MEYSIARVAGFPHHTLMGTFRIKTRVIQFREFDTGDGRNNSDKGTKEHRAPARIIRGARWGKYFAEITASAWQCLPILRRAPAAGSR